MCPAMAWTARDIPTSTAAPWWSPAPTAGSRLRSAEALGPRRRHVLDGGRNEAKGKVALDLARGGHRLPIRSHLAGSVRAGLDPRRGGRRSASQRTRSTWLMNNGRCDGDPAAAQLAGWSAVRYQPPGHFALTGLLMPWLLASDAPPAS